MVVGIFFQEHVVRDDECADKFALVGDDDHLIKVFVQDEFRLNHLRCDVLSVGRFEEVFDSFAEEEFSVLHVARVAGVEPSFLVDCLFGG